MPAAPKADWTLLVFMAGDNDLDEEGERDLMQMKSVTDSGRVRIAVQFDRAETGRNTRRFLLRHGSSLVSDVVENLGETNTGDPAVLRDFLLWGIRKYPAKRLMVVIWNHGGGADDTDDFATGGPRRRLGTPAKPKRRPLFLKPAVSLTGIARRKIALDVEAADFLDNLELKKVLADVREKLGRPIDILGLDACLMSMVEIAWQLRGSVSHLVGSQENEPAAGWPYDAILTALHATPAMKPEKLAATVVESYLASFPANEPVTQSACTVAKLPALVTAVDALAKALLARSGQRAFETAILTARQETLQFFNPDYIDLHHFCDRLVANTTDAKVISACGKVRTALTAAISAEGNRSAAMQDAHGLSIYFPLTARAPLYASLDFPGDCAWGKFLESFIPHLHPF